jgi:hypothetical protein
MGLFSRNKNISIIFSMEEGLQSIPKGMPVEVTLWEDELTIKQNFSKKEPSHLKYSQIINAGVVREEEIIEKSKSVLGRAAVGGLLLGPVGAIVGSISGTGKKEKVQRKAYYIINYKSFNDDETKVLSFQLTGNTLGLAKFETEMKEHLGIKDKENISEINL